MECQLVILVGTIFVNRAQRELVELANEDLGKVE